jgi:hypothetical protein
VAAAETSRRPLEVVSVGTTCAAIPPIESELSRSRAFGGEWGVGHVTYNGIEFTLKMVEPGIWKYRFYIGRGIKIGTTKTDLESLAIRRTQKRIDRELKIAGNYESA